jgi:hypothetical protein
MIKNTFILSTLVAIVLLLIAETAATTLLTTVHAQILGEPFFKETGKITGQKEIGPNRTQLSLSANGTLKDDVNVTIPEIL